MKRKNILLGSVGFIAAAACLTYSLVDFGAEAVYNQSDLSVFQKTTGGSDAQKWMAAQYLDAETGKHITPERLQEIMAIEKDRKRANIVFEELGPDNIGGRTRAILIDKNDPNKVWAGSVSGGLYASTDAANHWTRDDAFPGMPYISSMAQTEDLTVFVATGSNNEDWDGNGLYYKTANSDQWVLVPGTGTMTRITEVAAPQEGNSVFFATSQGLKKWTVGDASVTSITVNPGACTALQVSKDGQVIVVAVASRTFVSNDGGDNFTNVSGGNAGQIPTHSGRIEYAISPIKNSQGNYTVYASRTVANLSGMDVSHDNGMTWNQFIGSSDGGSLDIYRNQGTYNSILSVDPRNTERLLIGGIDIWEWEQTSNNPPAGGFDQLSQWFLSPTSDKYVHADNHEMKWDQNDRFYMGNDGGIGVSEDYGTTFYPANRGYNVTQFYGIAMDKHGAVMGGAQDNGTLYNDFSLFGAKNFREVGGGDGFECEISFFNPNIIFSSVYNNDIRRSFDKGFSSSAFIPDFPGSYGDVGLGGGAVHPFHTELVFAEYYDENSKDSVIFYPRANYNAGDDLRVPSMATGDTIDYVAPKKLYYEDTVYHNPSLTRKDYLVKNSATGANVDLGQESYTIQYNADGQGTTPDVGDSILLGDGTLFEVLSVTEYDHYFASSPEPGSNKTFDLKQEQVGYNVPWDTLLVADPYQSWFFVFVTANGGEIWGTRDAARFSRPAQWTMVANGLGAGYTGVDIEFTPDLKHCFVSCGSKVYRIDGLGSIYSQQADFATAATAAGTAKVTVSSLACSGIALNKSNPNDLLIIQAGFNGTVQRSNNATSASPTFSNLDNLGVAGYDAIIDREDPNVIVVGTAFGVRVSENGGSSWEDASAGFENVPVFEVRQNWRTWDEGCFRPGEIYLGTFGRGIWASSTYLSIGDDLSPQAEKSRTDLKVYPNPTTDVSVLSFNLHKASDVNVKVYNLAGQEVRSYNKKQLAKGTHTININASNLISGAYVVKFQAGNVTETVKFMKL
ncbi:MAG: T9SS type A sorting domain-containing protein [Bacteroidetes bacterium]|nr:MAG: T9SS type A sorting domain-containing protein [Bacteroidota bacterium]